MAFICELCGEEQCSEDDLRLHIKAAHDPENAVQCPFCDLAGISVNEMVLHIEWVHQEFPLKTDADSNAPLVDLEIPGCARKSESCSEPQRKNRFVEPSTVADILMRTNRSHSSAFVNVDEKGDVWQFKGRAIKGPQASSDLLASSELQQISPAVVNPTAGTATTSTTVMVCQSTPNSSACKPRVASIFPEGPSQSERSWSSGKEKPQEKRTPCVLPAFIPAPSCVRPPRASTIPAADTDDGFTRTADAMDRVRQHFKCPPASANSVSCTSHVNTNSVIILLCTACDHYAASKADSGWGCGYRNTQMLLSALMRDQHYREVVFNGHLIMPSIFKLQKLIEDAWRRGYDVGGESQLGCKLVRTRTWIGATEVWALLSSLRVRCQLIDFHCTTGPNHTHHLLFEWVIAYFHECSNFTLPLYLQHQGHSRTIIGIERPPAGKASLLFFDPSRRPMVDGNKDARSLIVRCHLQDLRAEQYQILAIRGILSDADQEEAKTVRSTRIP